MRKFILGSMIAASFCLTGVSTASAAPGGLGLAETVGAQTLLQKTASGDYCAYLRYKCNHKGQLGEYGEGNCRRYRQECGQISYCERLRRACIYKEERGEEGQGNCRRYRYECGGGRGW
jgi:hypothetical protein